MIFLAAGTQDGRELAGYLLERGQEVTASVVSRYGEQLLERYRDKGITVNDRPLDADALTKYLTEHRIGVLVDATHPYAANASENAMAACHRAGVPYLRYERANAPVDYDNVHRVASYEEAAKKAASLGKHIFLTTGSRNLRVFAESPHLRGCALAIRVLPSAEVLASCEELGFAPKQIIAMQGPFSQALNEELFRKYGADVIVTKNGGTVGGADTKVAAAKAMGLPVVLIERPAVAYDHVATTYEEVLAFVQSI